MQQTSPIFKFLIICKNSWSIFNFTNELYNMNNDRKMKKCSSNHSYMFAHSHILLYLWWKCFNEELTIWEWPLVWLLLWGSTVSVEFDVSSELSWRKQCKRRVKVQSGLRPFSSLQSISRSVMWLCPEMDEMSINIKNSSLIFQHIPYKTKLTFD